MEVYIISIYVVRTKGTLQRQTLHQKRLTINVPREPIADIDVKSNACLRDETSSIKHEYLFSEAWVTFYGARPFLEELPEEFEASKWNVTGIDQDAVQAIW